MKVFGRVPSNPQGMYFIHQKLVYFNGNNKFRGGLLGIKCSKSKSLPKMLKSLLVDFEEYEDVLTVPSG